MGRFLDSTYEIHQKLGSGGGGNVYLAEHKRLRKTIVLKADKRSDCEEEWLLRREADVLKNLNHPYIPRVYDYFVEDGISYTAMDYVEGYSLDRPLRDGMVFPQPDVIRIAVEVLSALHYLHTFPRGDGRVGYLHGDIKPANIMCRPDGNIVLIDFNISLSLGDEDAVGVSPGYASPEHYGIDYSTNGSATESYQYTTMFEGSGGGTDISPGTGSVSRGAGSQNPPSRGPGSPGSSSRGIGSQDPPSRGTGSPGSSSRGTGSQGSPSRTSSGRVLPNVRSDIYGVGATLYHLLSGVRPAQDARAVTPLTGTGQRPSPQAARAVTPLSTARFSPELVRIITKSMQPNPDLRYQSAYEMLQDFLHIRQHDPRTKRLKRLSRGILISASALLVAGILTSFTGLYRMQVRDRRLKLTEYARSAYEQGDPDGAVRYMKQVYEEGLPLLNPPQEAASQEVLTEVLGVYDLEDAYRPAGVIESPEEPQKVILSPDARILAVMHTAGLSLYDTADQSLICTLETEPSALADVDYADQDTVLYAGKKGITAYSISKKEEIWTGGRCTDLSISGDGTKAAAVFKNEDQAVLYDIGSGQEAGTFDFMHRSQSGMKNDTYINPENDLFALNEDGTKLAVSFDDGSVFVLDAKTQQGDGAGSGTTVNGNRQEGLCLFDSGSGYKHFEGGFSGKYLAVSAASAEETVFRVIDTESERQTAGTRTKYYMSSYADGENICACDGNYLVRLDPETGEQTPLTDTSHDIKRFRCSEGNTLISTGRAVEVYDAELNRVGLFQRDTACDRIDLVKDTAVVGSSGSTTINLLKYEETGPENRIGSYDASYGHDETRLNADGTRFMLFSNFGFRIYDRDGKLIKEHSFTAEETEPGALYDQQYVREGSSDYLKLYFYDGTIDIYDGSTGEYLRTENGIVPDTNLDQTFETESFLIEAPLHGDTTIKEKKTGKELSRIDEEAYVTYATEIGDGIVLQYVTTDGEFYGLELDRSGQLIARLPGLRDVKDQTFLFDYGNGSVYQSKALGLEELKRQLASD